MPRSAGMCHVFMDHWAEARPAFERVREFVRPHFSYDEFAQRAADKYLRLGAVPQVDQCIERIRSALFIR